MYAIGFIGNNLLFFDIFDYPVINPRFILIDLCPVTTLSLGVEISSFKSKDLWILLSFLDNINYCTLTYFHAFINI